MYDTRSHPSPDPTGVAHAVIAYGLWGFAPIYWKATLEFPAPELLAYRVLASLAVAIALVVGASAFREVMRVLRSPRGASAVALASLLLAANWLTFIYAVQTDRILATSLGYYINPLANVVLGLLVLRERLTRAQGIAVGIAAAGVAFQTWQVGALPWISLVLALSFGLYGLVRKLAPAAPLLAFASAARRLPLSTLGMIQFIAPTLALLLAVTFYGEPFTPGHAVGFGCAWSALALFVWDGNQRRSRPRAGAVASGSAVVCAAVFLAGCTPSVEPIVSCEVRGAARPVCGFQNPEDLVALPGDRALLVSEYGGMTAAKPGRLSRLDLATEERSVLFEAGDASGGPAAGWGDPECREAPRAFSPHGIDLVRRDDGRQALLVVNHAGRESVELFEVLEPEGRARVEWRGCVVPPAGSWLNDVAGLPDGGLLVSHMLPRREGVAQLYELARAALVGVASGHVLEWSPRAGFSVVPGSESVFANGVAVSPDGARVFVNATLGGRLRAIDRRSGRRLGEVAVESPDNLSWTADGRLLVASLRGSTLELRACDAIERGACPSPFEILAVDPETFAAEVIYRSDGATMGAGTVGLRVGSELFVGSFAGDRILRVDLSAGAGATGS